MRSPSAQKSPRARVYRNAAANAPGAVVLDAISYDSHGMLTNGALVIPAGWGGEWEADAIGSANVALVADNYWSAAITKNGVVIGSGNVEYQRAAAISPVSIAVVRFTAAPGDYIGLSISTNNGATALLVGVANGCGLTLGRRS